MSTILEPQLLTAAYRGDLAEVEKLITEGVDVNFLHTYSYWDRNLTDTEGYTALYLAVQKKHTSVVEALINAGANPNKMSWRGMEGDHAPLYQTSWWDDKGKNADIAKMLIKAGANVNLKHGYIIMDATNFGRSLGGTVLHYAADRGNLAVVMVLLNTDGIKVNLLNNNHDTALHSAVSCYAGRGYLSTNEKDVINRQTSIVHALLNAGIDVNKRNKDDQTALHIAAWGNLAILEILLKVEELDIHLQDKQGNTAIHMAAQNRNFAAHAMEALFKAGASAQINIQNLNGDSPLHSICAGVVCAEQGICFLLSKGAILDLKNKEGRTARKIKSENERLQVYHRIENRILVAADQLIEMAEESKESSELKGLKELKETFDGLLKILGPGLNGRSNRYQGNTALHLAIQNEKFDLTYWLLEANADLFIANEQGKTPLDLMNSSPKPEIRALSNLSKVKKLLTKPHASTESTHSPLGLGLGLGLGVGLGLEVKKLKEKEKEIEIEIEIKHSKDKVSNSEKEEIKELIEEVTTAHASKNIIALSTVELDSLKLIIKNFNEDLKSIQDEKWKNIVCYTLGVLLSGAEEKNKYCSLSPIFAIDAYNILSHVTAAVGTEQYSVVHSTLFTLLSENHVRFLRKGEDYPKGRFVAVQSNNDIDKSHEANRTQALIEHLTLSGPENPHKNMLGQLLARRIHPSLEESGIPGVEGLHDTVTIRLIFSKVEQLLEAREIEYKKMAEKLARLQSKDRTAGDSIQNMSETNIPTLEEAQKDSSKEEKVSREVVMVRASDRADIKLEADTAVTNSSENGQAQAYVNPTGKDNKYANEAERTSTDLSVTQSRPMLMSRADFAKQLTLLTSYQRFTNNNGSPTAGQDQNSTAVNTRSLNITSNVQASDQAFNIPEGFGIAESESTITDTDFDSATGEWDALSDATTSQNPDMQNESDIDMLGADRQNNQLDFARTGRRNSRS